MLHTLEKSKLFSPIVWLTILGFATFVFFFISNVSVELEELSEDTAHTEAELENFHDQIRRE